MNFLNEGESSWDIPSLETVNKFKIISKFVCLSSREFGYETPRGNEYD